MKSKKVHTTTDIVDQVSQKVDLRKSDVKEVITTLLETISESLENQEEINFTGYFQFSTHKQPPKEMIMRFGEKAGKKIKIPAKIVPKVKISPSLKKRVAQS